MQSFMLTLHPSLSSPFSSHVLVSLHILYMKPGKDVVALAVSLKINNFRRETPSQET